MPSIKTAEQPSFQGSRLSDLRQADEARRPYV